MTDCPDRIFCPLRKAQFAALPEEKIRIGLVKKMVDTLGYPPGNISVEKSLSRLPHLAGVPLLPKRSVDLLVFAKDLHPSHSLYPLLLIECKAVSLTDKVLRQVVGYNRFVQACFIGVADKTRFLIGHFDAGRQDYVFREELPSFESLTEHARLLLADKK